MAELAGSAFAAGRKVIEMVENAKECAEEAKEVAERSSYTLGILEDAVPVFDGNEDLSKRLLDLRHLFEHIEDTLKRCLPEHTSSSLTQTARRYVFSSANRKILSGYSGKLTRIAQDLVGPMLLVSKQQGDRIEDALVALTVEKSEDENPDPLLKLAKRQLRGKVIYEELKEEGTSLGSGSFGVVEAGTYYGRPVAIKKALGILHNPTDRESFRREASTHFALRHDRIVQVIAFSIGDDGRPPCLIMERMLKGTLNHYLGTFREDEQMSLSSSLPFVIDICEGLKYLHQCGVVHRDIKSLNILLDEQGAKVADFGLADVCSTIGRTTGNRQTQKQMGTFFWMAPEVHNFEKSSFDSDIFSLGVVIWEIIETRPGGSGPAPGSRLLVDPNAKLPMKGGDESDPARVRVQSLVRSCCTLERKKRPAVGAVLAKAKRIYDELPASEIEEEYSTATDAPQGSGGTPGASLSRSEARRRTHEMGSSEKGGGGWEKWKEIGRSILNTEEKIQTVQETQAAAAMATISSSIVAETLRISNVHLTYGGDGARTAIMIYNATGSPLRFRHNHDIHGHVKGSFPATIENGHWGSALHVKMEWALYGSEGFVVYTAQNGDGQSCDVNMCFMTPYRGDRSVYVEARQEGHWDKGQHVQVMTARLNENRGKSYDLSNQGLAVVGVIAHDSPRPCQFFVGLQGRDVPAPWA